MDPGGKIYRSDENKNEVGRYWVVSPQKVSRFAPLNRYYIIIDEVFLDNFLVIIYLLVVCKKKIIHSFWSVGYCKKGIYFSQKRIIVKEFRLLDSEWQQNMTKSTD